MPVRRYYMLLLVTLLALLPAACGGATTVVPLPTTRPAAPTYTPMPTFTPGPTRVLSTVVTAQTATVTPSPTVSPNLSVKDWERTTIAEAGIALDVPQSWKRLSTAWEWSAGSDGGPRIGAAWADAGQGREPTALLPGGAVSLDATQLALPWGTGTVYTVQVVAGKATTIEAHAIIRLGGKRDYDFYAVAATPEELSALRQILQHVLESVALLGG
jgi:hypothetical protein